VDMIAVVVRVPGHRALVMAGLNGGKAVFCEWPLGANLKEAQEMNDLASQKNLATVVGLQARSDPAIMYARDLVAQGYIGDVMAANMSVVTGAVVERGEGRIWQGLRTNGANTMTIAGGHSIDALCYILGEFTEVSARVGTLITEWKNTETGATMKVDAPDTVSVAGALQNGAEVSYRVIAVPHNPSGTRLEIYGRDGTLVVTSSSANIGPNTVLASKGKDPLAEMSPPDQYNLAPEGTPAGPARNVTQAYVRYADALPQGEAAVPDFSVAVTRHRLLDAIERSAAEGKSIKL